MNPFVERLVQKLYPTGKLSAINESVSKKYYSLKEAGAILEEINNIRNIEAERWHPDDELEKSLSILIVSPSLLYWSSKFHGQPADKRISVLRECGGIYCNLTLSISNISPFFLLNWTRFILRANGQIGAEFSESPPSLFWADVEKSIIKILEERGKISLTYDMAREEVLWMDVTDTDLEERRVSATIFDCFFREI